MSDDLRMSASALSDDRGQSGRFLLAAVFAVLAAVLAAGIYINKRWPVASVAPGGVPVPEIALPRLENAAADFSLPEMDGEVYLLNVWASWCAACRVEHPLLAALAADGVEIIGLNYKDTRPAATAWLRQHGDPYRLSIFDADGAMGALLGIDGAPATYLIDANKTIRLTHIGVLDRDTVNDTIRPLLQSLTAADG